MVLRHQQSAACYPETASRLACLVLVVTFFATSLSAQVIFGDAQHVTQAVTGLTLCHTSLEARILWPRGSKPHVVRLRGGESMNSDQDGTDHALAQVSVLQQRCDEVHVHE